MNKKFAGYTTYIVDVDGTLYFQKQVRVQMFCTLACYYFFHPLCLSELLALYKYRKIREIDMFKGDEDFEHKEYCYVAKLFKKEPEWAQSIIERWMHSYPLKIIAKNRDCMLIKILQERRNEGARVIIYSDYPVEDKLNALGMQCDSMYYSGDEIISCLKPESRGLANIVKKEDLRIEDCLFIGDRYEKDGLCAKSIGMDYYILKRNKRKRIYPL